MQGIQTPGANASSGTLVIESLKKMAEEGYDVGVLNNMQDQTLRSAAQLIQHRKAAGKVTSAAQLHIQVNRILLRHSDLTKDGDVTQAHLRAFEARAGFLRSSTPAASMREAEAIASMQLPASVFGPNPSLHTSNWLAKHVVDVTQYANRIESKSPMFTASLKKRCAELCAAYQDMPNLQIAMDVLNEAAEVSPDDNERHSPN